MRSESGVSLFRTGQLARECRGEEAPSHRCSPLPGARLAIRLQTKFPMINLILTPGNPGLTKVTSGRLCLRARLASHLSFRAFHVAFWAFPGPHVSFRALCLRSVTYCHPPFSSSSTGLCSRTPNPVLALTRLRFVITEVMYNSFAYIQLPLVGPPVKTLLSPPHSLSSPAPLHATPEASAQQSHVIACHRITQQPHHQQCRV